MKRFLRGAWVVGFSLMSAMASSADVKPPLTVFAAASLTDVLQRLGKTYQERTGQEINFSFAASSTLARQIELGGKMDIFISADEEWMDYLEKRGRIEPSTTRIVAGNRLVVVVPSARANKFKSTEPVSWQELFGEGRIAIGDPTHVPAGRYARHALEHLGLWTMVQPRIVPAMTVRDALLWAERGEAMAAVVYRSDAKISRRVVAVAEFPVSSYPPIHYPAAVVKGGNREAALSFLASLSSPGAQTEWVNMGFLLPTP